MQHKGAQWTVKGHHARCNLAWTVHSARKERLERCVPNVLKIDNTELNDVNCGNTNEMNMWQESNLGPPGYYSRCSITEP